MSLPDLENCPGTLAEGFNTYSSGCLKALFDGKKVNHVLPYEAPGLNEDVFQQFVENRKRISLSGVQEKLSLVLDKNRLRLTRAGERGSYILKPIPRDLKRVDQVPANEHLTMQIAAQVYGIRTAANALVFFKNGDPAYITRRFDVKPDGSKWGVEDFASLSGKTTENAGPDFKYAGSYEALGALIRKFVLAWRVEIEKYFVQVVFNYLFSNGDAHLKNFSLMESSSGDYLLSPAYDLICTRLHVDDTDFALDRGMFEDDFRSERFRISGHPSRADFVELAHRIGLAESRIEKLLQLFLHRQDEVDALIGRSFLSDEAKRGYLHHYHTKRNFLTT